MNSKWFHHISSTKYISPFSNKIIALHQNVANCQNNVSMFSSDNQGRKEEVFYLTTHSTHFIYGYMASDIW